MRFIELFAGIGGFRLGLERANHRCVWSNEWLEKPASIYERRFKDKPDRRDIREVKADELPDADIIVGGFPCATFSYAGKRTGLSLDDTRGTLFYEMFRLARDKEIPYILFENVKGLLGNDSGNTFKTMLKALDEMGYDAQWELLDSQNFGVPQHRERIFVVANLRGKPRPKVFPITSPDRKDDSEGQRVQEEKRFDIAHWRRSHFRYNKSGVVPTLTGNMGTGGNNVPLVRMHMRAHSKANMKQREQMRDSTWTLDTAPQSKMAVDTGNGWRKLTPIECERLHGFPDDFTRYYADGSEVSNAQRYERLGRTVSVPVIYEIGKRL